MASTGGRHTRPNRGTGCRRTRQLSARQVAGPSVEASPGEGATESPPECRRSCSAHTDVSASPARARRSSPAVVSVALGAVPAGAPMDVQRKGGRRHLPSEGTTVAHRGRGQGPGRCPRRSAVGRTARTRPSAPPQRGRDGRPPRTQPWHQLTSSLKPRRTCSAHAAVGDSPVRAHWSTIANADWAVCGRERGGQGGVNSDKAVLKF